MVLGLTRVRGQLLQKTQQVPTRIPPQQVHPSRSGCRERASERRACRRRGSLLDGGPSL